MTYRNVFAVVLACSAFTAVPAFSQEESYRQEVSGQVFGSFVKDTWQDRIKQKATDSGGALASYRFLFDKHNGVEVNYGYSLNTQIYTSPTFARGVNSYLNEATAAYVYRYPLNRWSLFALAGTGALIFNARNTPGVGSQARAAGLYGGGCDFGITKQLFVRAEYRGLIYNSPTYDQASLARMDRVTQRFEPSIGLGWRF